MTDKVYTYTNAAPDRPVLLYAMYAPSWVSQDVAGMFVDSYTKSPYEPALIRMAEHLPRAKILGATHVYTGPILASLWSDMGFDVADYTMVDPRLGENDHFDRFIKRAHDLGLKVIMDLILNHTSTAHRWFHREMELYHWSGKIHPGWANLFGDEDGSWAWDIKRGQFYLHLFSKSQADLNWFPNGLSGAPNPVLVERFRNIVSYWLAHGVDGFRIDAPQALNKDLEADTLVLEDLIYGGGPDVDVINAIFTGDGAPKTQDGGKPFLLAEIFEPDPSGEIISFYSQAAPVIDFFVNPLLRDHVGTSLSKLKKDIWTALRGNPKLMLCLGDHDSMRFRSRDCAPKDFAGVMELLTEQNPIGIYLYQGDELGLYNPTKGELPDHYLLSLDAMAAAEHFKNLEVKKHGPAGAEIPAEMRARSRANVRIPLSMKQYGYQESSPDSNLATAKTILHNWLRRMGG